MARTEQAIFTNLCMVCDQNGNILVQDRHDPDWPGVSFPGGHVEPGESFVDAVIREVWEETGLTIEEPTLCGTKQFQTGSGARYVVFFYRTNRFTGELKSSDEGEVFWLSREKLPQYRCVSDFMDMVKVMESADLNEFQYTVRDENWEIRLL